jgi:hypothetical protein
MILRVLAETGGVNPIVGPVIFVGAILSIIGFIVWNSRASAGD